MKTMIRTQVSLLQADKTAADQVAGWHGVSMAEIIRRALKDYLQKQQQKRAEKIATIERLAGSWKNSPNWKGIDAVKYQREIRREKGI